MTEKIALNGEEIERYKRRLRAEERSEATAEKYVRNITLYGKRLNGKAATKESAIEWKEELIKSGCAPETINACLAAVNKLFAYHNKPWKLKYVHVQRKTYRDDSRDLSRAEYDRLLETLKKDNKKKRLSLIIETICSTGIRASELKYITVEAVNKREAEISLKGKTRTVLLPEALCRKLLKYISDKGIKRGTIFITRNKTPIDRRQIWSEMKKAGIQANIKGSKVYPHNLRHLFARTFYGISKDIAKLADVLGHSSVDTTRIYLISTGTEHRHTLDKMRLVS
ncbi:MAG: tyrosine-type recombinase/integrase [Clostridia bacterium]|nr:tyrosine-type recombinase/integrase [Clostridia bacterium]